MNEWKYAQKSASEKLAQLHFFSVTKVQNGREIVFKITVREFVTPEIAAMRFFAETDLQTNQHTAPYTPCGWGNTLLAALSDCITAVHRFPYEGPDFPASNT